MPNEEIFVKEFGFVINSDFGPYTLSSASSTHKQIHRFREYYYEIDLIFNKNVKNINKKNFQIFIEKFNQITNQVLYIQGIRNYYKCSIDSLKKEDIRFSENNDKINIRLYGHAYNTYVKSKDKLDFYLSSQNNMKIRKFLTK